MRYLTFGVMAVVLGAGVFLSEQSQATEPDQDVAGALAELQSWLGKSDYAKTWNKYLLTDELKSELAKPQQAEPKKLAAVLARYESGAVGLDKPKFVAVRKALSAWLSARVESTLPARSELAKLAANIQQQMGPKTDEDVARARQQLQAASASLGKYLDAHGRKGGDWKRFLLWNQLETIVKAKSPDEKTVKEVLARFEADKDGLEMKQYTAVRKALRNYYYVEQARKLSNVSQSISQKVVGLPPEPRFQALLKDYGPESRHLGAVKIGAYIGELERFQQAPTLVLAVRRHLSHPNLTAYISADLVSAALGEKLDEQIDVEENILGTHVTGKGHLTGQLIASLLPDEQKGTIGLALTGKTTTKTTGQNGPVTIYSRGVTQLEGGTQIVLTGDGVTHAPATGKATTKTNVEGLSTRRNGPASRIVERAAWKKVGESKGEAEQIASQRAAARLKQRMNQQADKSLSKANHNYAYKFRDPMVRRDAFPQLLNVRTTASAIEVLMQQATADQLAAPAPPASLEQKHDIGVRLHESLLNNLAATRFGGETITDKSASEAGQTAEEAEKLKKEVDKQKARNRAERFAKMNDEEKKVEMARREKADKEQTFSVTLAQLNPVTIDLRDGKMKLTIRGTAFKGIDGKNYDENPMSIWAVYHIELGKDGGLTLAMKDLEKDWGVMTTESEYGGPAVAGAEILRAKLKARFGDIFTDLYQIELEPIVLRDKLKRLGKLAYRQADAKDGWLTLAWDRVSKAASEKKADNSKSETTPASFRVLQR